MSGWKNTDAQANNKPVYISHIGRDANTTNNYIANTVLVTVTRDANANVQYGVANSQVAHTGWVNLDKGHGYVAGVSVSNVSPTKTYTNTYLTFSTSTGTVANASLFVTNGNNVSVVLNSGGSDIRDTPTVTASGANNTTLVFTVVPGGRMGRVSSEVLVALSAPSSADANGAEPWFHGNGS